MENKTKKTGIVVFTHGSRPKAANDMEVRFVESLRRRLGTPLIEPAFMEISDPTIPDAIEKLVAAGCTHIFGYAFFLVSGRHLSQDIPAIFDRALKNHPGITYEITEPLMDDPELIHLVENRLRGAL